jgi:hypothetical protein
MYALQYGCSKAHLATHTYVRASRHLTVEYVEPCRLWFLLRSPAEASANIAAAKRTWWLWRRTKPSHTSAQSFGRELSSEQHTSSVNVDDKDAKAFLLDKLSERKVPLLSALSYTCIRMCMLVLVVLYLLYILHTAVGCANLHEREYTPRVPYVQCIVLPGDSLVNKPLWMFGLGGKIADRLPSHTYQIYSQAQRWTHNLTDTARTLTRSAFP